MPEPLKPSQEDVPELCLEVQCCNVQMNLANFASWLKYPFPRGRSAKELSRVDVCANLKLQTRSDLQITGVFLKYSTADEVCNCICMLRQFDMIVANYRYRINLNQLYIATYQRTGVDNQENISIGYKHMATNSILQILLFLGSVISFKYYHFLQSHMVIMVGALELEHCNMSKILDQDTCTILDPLLCSAVIPPIMFPVQRRKFKYLL